VFVDDVVHAFDAVLHMGLDGEVYNIGTSFEVDMLTLARMIVMAMGLVTPGDSQAADEFIEFVEDRNINDRRCVLFCLRIQSTTSLKTMTLVLQLCGRSLPLIRNGMESINVIRSWAPRNH
jgi:dTDP-D-glucose 4,6-dehydratase